MLLLLFIEKVKLKGGIIAGIAVGAAVGVTSDMHDRIAALDHVGVDAICIDTAHGHSRGVLNAVKKAKEAFPYLQIIGGNVATGEGAKALVDAGVNAVKVGVGPGSICTTRIVAGVGVPQLYAIKSAYEGIKNSGVPIVGEAEGLPLTGVGKVDVLILKAPGGTEVELFEVQG